MTMELIAFLGLVAVVAWWVLRPLGAEQPAAAAPERANLEAEREIRVAAIRDAELDAQTGKISPERHRELDAILRDEALQTMRELGDR
jgi:hypothetical protein